jgi:hypothetical protein
MMNTGIGSWTDAQRKLLFSLMGKVDFTKEDMEASLKFPMSELSVAEASALIDCLKNNGDLSETVGKIKEKHGAAKGPLDQVPEKPANSPAKAQVEPPASKESSGLNIPKSIEEARKNKAEKIANAPAPAPREPSHDVQEITTEPLDWSAIHSNPEQYVRRLNYLYLHLLQKGTDYGIIPGTPRPTLYKAGAELLAMNLGLTTETTETTELKEMFGTPMIICNAHTEVSWNGKKIADGYGSCSSGETKYAFRWYSESKLPKNLNKDTLYSEEGQYGKRYRVPSSLNEIMDVGNTVKKMAIKRAYVDAVLRATGASRIFTQDVEDMAGDRA